MVRGHQLVSSNFFKSNTIKWDYEWDVEVERRVIIVSIGRELKWLGRWMCVCRQMLLRRCHALIALHALYFIYFFTSGIVLNTIITGHISFGGFALCIWAFCRKIASLSVTCVWVCARVNESSRSSSELFSIRINQKQSLNSTVKL